MLQVLNVTFHGTCVLRTKNVRACFWHVQNTCLDWRTQRKTFSTRFRVVFVSDTWNTGHETLREVSCDLGTYGPTSRTKTYFTPTRNKWEIDPRCPSPSDKDALQWIDHAILCISFELITKFASEKCLEQPRKRDSIVNTKFSWK